MSGRSDDSNEEFERALRGGGSGSPVADDLAAFVEDVRAAFPRASSLAEEQHLAALVTAAQVLAANSERAARSARKASGRTGHVSEFPKRRRVTVKVPVFKSLAAKLAAAAVVVMTSFGGLAVAGALPRPVQHAVANAADTIGVNLPGGDDEDATESVEPVEQGEDETEVESDDQGEDGTEVESDDQGENETEVDSNDQGEDEQVGDQGEDETEVDSNDQGEDEQVGDQGENDQ